MLNIIPPNNSGKLKPIQLKNVIIFFYTIINDKYEYCFNY